MVLNESFIELDESVVLSQSTVFYSIMKSKVRIVFLRKGCQLLWLGLQCSVNLIAMRPTAQSQTKP